MECRRIVVRGRVQGVGFRAFVVSCAVVHGVVGEVWNTREGCVEVVACSPSLDGFVAALYTGPGRVDEVLVSAHASLEAHDFRIVQSR